MTPSSVSPVLNSVLTITLASSYAHPLVAEEFDAVLVLSEDVTVTRPLYIMSVDDSAKEIQIKFPGAESGNYHVQLSSL